MHSDVREVFVPIPADAAVDDIVVNIRLVYMRRECYLHGTRCMGGARPWSKQSEGLSLDTNFDLAHAMDQQAKPTVPQCSDVITETRLEKARAKAFARQTSLTIGVRGEMPVLDGPLWKGIKVGTLRYFSGLTLVS